MKDKLVLYRLDKVSEYAVVSIDEKIETFWLMPQQIADLIGVRRPPILKHLSASFYREVLDEKVVCSILEHTTLNDVWRHKDQKTGIKFNFLNAVLAVGYQSFRAELRSFVLGYHRYDRIP